MDADDSRIAAISDAFTSHWRMFGQYPGAELHDEDGVLWYRSPIRHIPYNAVVQTRIGDTRDAGSVIARIADRFRAFGLPFMWPVLPLDQPAGTEQHLRHVGLDLGEEAMGMSLDLADWSASGAATDATIVSGDGEPQITDYEQLIRVYWHLPDEDRPLIPILNRYLTGTHAAGTRLVAYADGKPVGKLFLNLAALPRAAVYGVSVVEEMRGRGYARALMEAAIGIARERGASLMVLHASEMGKPVYERLGFVTRCRLPIYSTAPIFDTHHH